MKKKKILVISGAAILAMFGFAGTCVAMNKPAHNYIAHAEGEEEVNTTEIAEQAAEETTNKFKKIWETYLLPAVLSVNIGSIIATITSIIFAIKNYKNHQRYTYEIKDVAELVITLSKQMGEYIVMMMERNQKTADLLAALGSANEVVEKQMALINEEKTSFEELKKAVVALINVEAELAKNNPEFVKNGLAMQIVEMKNQLMKVAR